MDTPILPKGSNQNELWPDTFGGIQHPLLSETSQNNTCHGINNLWLDKIGLHSTVLVYLGLLCSTIRWHKYSRPCLGILERCPTKNVKCLHIHGDIKPQTRTDTLSILCCPRFPRASGTRPITTRTPTRTTRISYKKVSTRASKSVLSKGGR